MNRPLIEEGSALAHLEGDHLAARAAQVTPPTNDTPLDLGSRRVRRFAETERFHTLVIGGGQAGLSVGYHLARRGFRFVILDAQTRTGDSWRHRWDSLRLFTPAMFDGLDGMRFPARSFSFPTKDEMADYLESYAQRFALPVRHGIRVDRLWHEGDRYVATAGNRRFEAQNVVVAMANYQVPWTPPVAAGLDPGIRQIHSRDYRNPSQLNPGSVLMVGGGNSGAEIAVELAGGHRIWMAGRDTGHVPFRTDGLLARLFMARFMLRVVFHRLLTLSTPMGRRARPDLISKGTRLIRVKPADLARAGVERVPRVAGVENGFPRLEDGRVLKPANVVWCTGFRPGFSWIDLPVMDATAEPVHQRGVVTAEPGLYFVGLHFLHALSSSMIHGVGRDVRYVVDVLTRRSKAAQAAGQSSGALTTRSETQVRAAV